MKKFFSLLIKYAPSIIEAVLAAKADADAKKGDEK